MQLNPVKQQHKPVLFCFAFGQCCVQVGGKIAQNEHVLSVYSFIFLSFSLNVNGSFFYIACAHINESDVQICLSF